MDLYIKTAVETPRHVIRNIVEKMQKSFYTNTSLGFLIGERRRTILQYRAEDFFSVRDVIVPKQTTHKVQATINPADTYDFINDLKKNNKLDEFLGLTLYTGDIKLQDNKQLLESLNSLRLILNQNLIGMILNSRAETTVMKTDGSVWIYTYTY